MTKRKLIDIKKIIIHCSDSDFGNVDVIDQWHKMNGWDGCGYHYVICNGIAFNKAKYDKKTDGLIQVGRNLTTVGAHCRGHNFDSIGICLIGKRHFTGRQLLGALPDLLVYLGVLGISCHDIYAHSEFSSKTCPNIDPCYLRIIGYKGGLNL